LERCFAIAVSEEKQGFIAVIIAVIFIIAKAYFSLPERQPLVNHFANRNLGSSPRFYMC